MAHKFGPHVQKKIDSIDDLSDDVGNHDGPIPAAPPLLSELKRILLFFIVILLFVFTAITFSSHKLLIRSVLHRWNHFLQCQPDNNNFPFTSLEAILQSTPDPIKAADWSKYYTSQPHSSGEGKEQAFWTAQRWDEFGIPSTKIIKYDAVVGEPVFQQIALFNHSEVLYKAKAMEKLPPDDNTKILTAAYFGNSASGNITTQFVYANFGLEGDYDELERRGVDIKGKISVVKNGFLHRSEKVLTAAKRGLVGTLMYTDPQQDGNVTEGNGFKPYPEGFARPETYIERGSVGMFRGSPSAGNPSIPGISIPSLPVSYGDIIPILKALQGHGPKASEMSSSWHDGGLYYRGVEYYAGPSPPHLVLNLNNQMAFPMKEVHQVFGIINGSIDDEVIVIGNHRDSWTAGAGDSTSGAAALMEVVRSFGLAYKAGWRPRRTLVFASWEGEELGQIGSRPWISENLAWLRATTVAYLNVVVAGGGPSFQAKASPMLRETIHYATKAVSSPSPHFNSVFDSWGGEISAAGGGDAIPFLQHACISTSDISFGASFWPYHSNFDTWYWMNSTGDPGWNYHATTAKVWGLMAAYLSESPVLKIKAGDYASALKTYIVNTKKRANSRMTIDLEPLENAVERFYDASALLDAYAERLEEELVLVNEEVRKVNQKYIQLERNFCYDDEHLVYKTSPFYQNPPEFPRLIRGLERGNLTEALKWMELIRSHIEDATALLQS